MNFWLFVLFVGLLAMVAGLGMFKVTAAIGACLEVGVVVVIGYMFSDGLLWTPLLIFIGGTCANALIIGVAHHQYRQHKLSDLRLLSDRD